jgi:hypothetical protein
MGFPSFFLLFLFLFFFPFPLFGARRNGPDGMDAEGFCFSPRKGFSFQHPNSNFYSSNPPSLLLAIAAQALASCSTATPPC